MTMTMKEHMEMMDRIRQGKNAKLSKIKTTRAKNDNITLTKQSKD